ncbi:MAG TPA: deoxyribose-phosphate aldolase [Lentisphaeria bacterium]|nr:MAG: deoxyribose-phosphate aldolase [Lentisphaerae bacterium GWF2_50_93]HCE46273.1 deoxyribose-phosphate aldolase [Lentisphaeria bacterium]
MKDTVTVAEIAGMIDHSLLSQTLTDKQLVDGCEVAKKSGCAAVCVKPYHTKLAAECVKGTAVRVCAVIGFPHGNSAIEVKAFETEQVIRDGAVEVDMVVNLGKVIQEDWDYILDELKTLVAITRRNKALLKVIFENDLLPDDKYKLRLCDLCNKAEVDFAKTSTGYNYIKAADGHFTYRGATEPDLALMRRHCSPKVQVKAAGGIRTVRAFIRAMELGVTRIGISQTTQLLEEAKKLADSKGTIHLPLKGDGTPAATGGSAGY